MPFDPARNIDTDPLKHQRFTVETDGSEFVPDIHHIADDLVLLADGSLLAMINIPGFPYELESMALRNARRRQINAVIRGVADNNVVIHVHLCRHNHVPPLPRAGRFRTRFLDRLFAKYEQNVLLGQLVAVDWYLSIVVSPRFSPAKLYRTKTLPLLAKFGLAKRPKVKAGSNAIYQIGSITQSLLAYFSKNGARRLGLRRDPVRGFMCSEIAEARRLIITGYWRAVPLTTGTLGASIYTARVICGTIANQINALDGFRLAKTVAMRDYPTDFTRTGQLSDVVKAKYTHDGLDIRFSFVMSQSFRFQTREESSRRLYLRVTRLFNALSSQKRGIEKIGEVKEEVEAGETVRGYHNFGITVFSPDLSLERLHRMTGAIETAMINSGTTPIVDDTGSFGAFWSALPGCDATLGGRSGSISFKNFTALASYEGFPTGNDSDCWGPAILRFPTSGGTAYDWVSHVGDIGHGAFIGRSSSGKTLLMILLACALQQVKDEDDKIFYFDKDQAAQPCILACGGTYLTLKLGVTSGLNPLRGLPDTPENRTFLEHWIATLMTADDRGSLRDSTVKMLQRGVALQMELPPEQRSLGAVRAFLGFGDDTDGSRLDRWCAGGADGWLFDGGDDAITLAKQFCGFDFTELFDHPACSHVAAYLLQRVRRFIDGRKITVICDEVRKYLLTKIFEEAIIDFSLTLRKKNGQLWVAAQEPAHIKNSRIGKDLVNQAQTLWVYPASEANKEEYEDLGLTNAMCRAVTEDMPALPYRSVLMKRETGSAIFRVQLTDMEDEIRVLSGRAETVAMIPAILDRVGDDPDAFVAEFIHRCRVYYGKKPKSKDPCDEIC